MQPEQVQVQEAEGCYKSRWGYHACDYATFKKIKTLRRIYELILRQRASHDRWSRKLIGNRVIRTYVRNAKGQKIGVASMSPMPEPHVCPVMKFKTPTMEEVLSLSNQTRWPAGTPVKKLTQETLEFVNRLYEAAVAYEASR